MPVFWLNLTVVFFVQLLLFLIHAYFEGKLAVVPRILWQSTIAGVVFGPPLDLLIGKYLGIFSYAFGFGPLILIFYAVLLYGIFFANILLMQQARFMHFCVWTTVVLAVFEITNLYFRFWTYAFAVPSVEYLIVAFVLPLSLAVLIAGVWQVLFGYRFAFLRPFTDGTHV